MTTKKNPKTWAAAEKKNEALKKQIIKLKGYEVSSADRERIDVVAWPGEVAYSNNGKER